MVKFLIAFFSGGFLTLTFALMIDQRLNTPVTFWEGIISGIMIFLLMGYASFFERKSS